MPSPKSDPPASHLRPFLHPTLKWMHVTPWKGPLWTYFAHHALIRLPVAGACYAMVRFLNRDRAYVRLHGLTRHLHRMLLWAQGAGHEWGHSFPSLKAPVVFPYEPVPALVDAGMLEPLFALCALGLPVEHVSEGTANACQQLRLKEGFEFPSDLIQALKVSGVKHVAPGELGYTSVLLGMPKDTRFREVVCEWARGSLASAA